MTKVKSNVRDYGNNNKALIKRKVLISYIMFKDVFNNVTTKELLKDTSVIHYIDLKPNTFLL
jgi:hypothetical protein